MLLAITMEHSVLAFWELPLMVTSTLGKYIAPPKEIVTLAPPLMVTLLLALLGAWSSNSTPFKSGYVVLLKLAERLAVPPVMERLEFPSSTMLTFVPVTVPLKLIAESLKKYVPPVWKVKLPPPLTVRFPPNAVLLVFGGKLHD